MRQIHGIWGASRHALTVGFVAMMVFCIGQRVLPAFSGMRLLFSPRLMFVGLLFLSLGARYASVLKSLLTQRSCRRLGAGCLIPLFFELVTVTALAVNLIATFLLTSTASQSLEPLP